MRRLLIKTDGRIDDLTPVFRRMNVDFDNAWVRRDLDDLYARIIGWRIAFDMNLDLHVSAVASTTAISSR